MPLSLSRPRRNHDDVAGDVLPDVNEPEPAPPVDVEAQPADLSTKVVQRLVALEDKTGMVLDSCSHLAGRMEALEEHNDRENRMYAELEQLRRADALQRSLPLVMDVIHVVDRLREREGASDFLDSVDAELIEALRRSGVEEIWRDPELPFDPSVQQQVGLLDDLDDRSMAVMSAGYRYGERVIRYQQVRIKPSHGRV